MVDEEWLKIIVEFASSALGFMFALLVNHYVHILRDKSAYRSMLAAIKSEAESNSEVLHHSFLKYYKEGVVLREFSVVTAVKYLSNSLFVTNAKSSQLEKLNNYLRNINLANAYRGRAEHIQFTKEGEEWLCGLISNWEENLKLCEASINEVIALL